MLRRLAKTLHGVDNMYLFLFVKVTGDFIRHVPAIAAAKQV